MKLSKKKRTLTAVGLLLLLICYAVGIRYIVGNVSSFGNEGGENTKHYVAVIAKSTKSDFWQTVFAGANAASTEYNLSITVDGPENEEDFETQNRMIEEAVANGAEVIIFSAVDYNANADAINAAVKQGVKVVVIDSDVNSDKVSSRISTDNYQAGRMAGEAVLNSQEANLNVGIVNFDINSANGQQREEGFREMVGGDSRVQILDAVNVISTTEASKKATLQMLDEHPEINYIVTFNEWTSLGVGEAIKEREYAEKVSVVAFDSNVASIGLLETGEVDALIVQNPYAMGYLGVEAAYNLIYDLPLGETKVDTATTLVTKENMYEDEFQRVLFSFN
ncbi:MAG: substrate-binding domain-containing protein [Lachnospiraceae bacterium]